MTRTALVASLFAVLPAMSLAAVTVNIATDGPSHVYLDGNLTGTAPLKLAELAPGTHSIRVVNAATGLAKDYAIYSPRTAHLDRDITVQWTPGAPLQQPAPAAAAPAAPVPPPPQTAALPGPPPGYAPQAVPGQPVYAPAQPAYYPAAQPAYYPVAQPGYYVAPGYYPAYYHRRRWWY